MSPEFFTSISTIVSCITALALVYLRKDLHKAKEEIKTSAETAVKNANGTLTHAINSLRTPAYIKRLKYKNSRPVMIYQQVNQLYADLFGLRAEDMINKTDLEAGVPKSVADVSHIRDIEAWSSGKEIVYIKDLGNGNFIQFEIIPLKETPHVMAYQVGKHCKGVTQKLKEQNG